VGAVLVVSELEEVLSDALVDVHPGAGSATLEKLLDEVAARQKRRRPSAFLRTEAKKEREQTKSESRDD
jgi:hypothetical protein